MISKVRPIEWVLLTFLVAVTVMVGPRLALQGAWSFAEARSREVFLGLFIVVTVQQLVKAFRQPWAEPSSQLRLKLLVWLPIALLPLLVGIGNGAFDRELWERLAGPFDALVVLQALLVFLRVFGFGAPTLLLWLALWDTAQREGTISGRRFITQTTRSTLAALRDWVPLLMLISGYVWIGEVMELSVQTGVDDALRAIDRRLFGTDPVVALQAVISRPLSVWLAFAYSMYAMFYAVVPSVIWLTAGRKAFRELAFALGFAMAVTWFSYLVFPAKGPVLSQAFEVPLDMYFIEPVKEALMDAGRITWDCFPSMHTCATLIFWFISWRHARWLFWALAPLAISIPFACVYLRYHYVIDVIAGIVLAIGVTAIARKLGAEAPADRLTPREREDARDTRPASSPPESNAAR